MNVTKEEDLYQIVGENIKIFRKKNNFSQAQLAERVGLSRTTIVNIEQGKQHISLFQLWRLADSLSVQMQNLLPHQSEKSTINPSLPDSSLIRLNLRDDAVQRISDFMQTVNAKNNQS